MVIFPEHIEKQADRNNGFSPTNHLHNWSPNDRLTIFVLLSPCPSAFLYYDHRIAQAKLTTSSSDGLVVRASASGAVDWV